MGSLPPCATGRPTGPRIRTAGQRGMGRSRDFRSRGRRRSTGSAARAAARAASWQMNCWNRAVEPGPGRRRSYRRWRSRGSESTAAVRAAAAGNTPGTARRSARRSCPTARRPRRPPSPPAGFDRLEDEPSRGRGWLGILGDGRVDDHVGPGALHEVEHHGLVEPPAGRCIHPGVLARVVGAGRRPPRTARAAGCSTSGRPPSRSRPGCSPTVQERQHQNPVDLPQSHPSRVPAETLRPRRFFGSGSRPHSRHRRRPRGRRRGPAAALMASLPTAVRGRGGRLEQLSVPRPPPPATPHALLDLIQPNARGGDLPPQDDDARPRARATSRWPPTSRTVSAMACSRPTARLQILDAAQERPVLDPPGLDLLARSTTRSAEGFRRTSARRRPWSAPWTCGAGGRRKAVVPRLPRRAVTDDGGIAGWPGVPRPGLGHRTAFGGGRAAGTGDAPAGRHHAGLSGRGVGGRGIAPRSGRPSGGCRGRGICRGWGIIGGRPARFVSFGGRARHEQRAVRAVRANPHAPGRQCGKRRCPIGVTPARPSPPPSLESFALPTPRHPTRPSPRPGLGIISARYVGNSASRRSGIAGGTGVPPVDAPARTGETSVRYCGTGVPPVGYRRVRTGETPVPPDHQSTNRPTGPPTEAIPNPGRVLNCSHTESDPPRRCRSRRSPGSPCLWIGWTFGSPGCRPAAGP